MEATIREFIGNRAAHQCEYCRGRQADEPFFSYQIEHVIAKQHGGVDDPANLALACPHCNRHKGPNLAGLDPLEGRLTRLFNPREDRWDDHFVARGPLFLGQTAIGRTTVRVLNMNDRDRVEFRAQSWGW